MVVNPKVALKKGWVYSSEMPIDAEKQLQMNGIDLRVDLVYGVHQGVLLKDESAVFSHKSITPTAQGRWRLSKGNPYAFVCVESVSIPPDCCAMLFMRSSLNRMGVPILSGLYDSGFNNKVSATFYPFIDVVIERYARVCQVIFLRAESASLYNGRYQGKPTKSRSEASPLNDVSEFALYTDSLVELYRSRSSDYGSYWKELGFNKLSDLMKMKLDRVQIAESVESKIDSLKDLCCYSILCMRALEMKEERSDVRSV